MRNKNTIWLLREKTLRTIHFFALMGMLNSTIAAPLKGMAEVYYLKYGFYDLSNSGGNQYLQNPDKSFSEVGQIATDNPLAETSRVSESEPVILPENPGIKNNVNIFYPSDISEGTIGITTETPFDNGSDNIFKIDLPDLPQKTDKAYLIYDLFGVQDFNAVSRSINDRPSVGGYVIKKNSEWSHQKEEINGEWLLKGENRILFTLANKARHFYKIKNLKIEIEKDEKSLIDQKIVIQQQSTVFSKAGKVFVKGFLRSFDNKAKIDIDGEELEVNNGEFEGFIPLIQNNNQNFLLARATDENGVLGQITIPVTEVIEADIAYPIEKKALCVSGFFEPALSTSMLAIDGANIALTDSSITQDIQLSVTQMRKIDIAPLESGMINVTKGGKAYRFTPDGMHFNKPVKISVDYDTSLIPDGYKADDIKTFYYNTTNKRWEAIQTDTINRTSKTVVSLTDHFTDYINGIIQVPESPQTSAFAPTMMNDIKAADPSSNITLISPPEASQTGDANISYPIKIPAGRKGMQPQLALQYSSEGGDSWIGNGWNLSVPGISIDTRWGVPTFGDLNGDGDIADAGENIETELYSLAGEQLMYPPVMFNGKSVDWMPNRHSDSLYSVTTCPRLTQDKAIFTFRKQGSFAKIQRLGSSPLTYYWKVTGTDGTINWYGGRTATGGVDTTAVTKSAVGIVYWALVMTEDVYGNNVKYTYDNKYFTNVGNSAQANLLNGRMFYLKNITYTGFNGADGNYKVEFLRQSSVKSGATINARNGLKQVDPYLLDSIKVSYKNGFIRSYKLSYNTGKFYKSLLTSISENDKTGKEFYKHTFEYYDDVKQNGLDTYYSTTSNIENLCADKCFTVSFPIPDTSAIRYTYAISTISCSYCNYTPCPFPYSLQKIYSYTINGNTFYPQPDNLYLSHFKNHVLTNLCPSYAITTIDPDIDPVTRNTDFVTDCKNWIYKIFAPYSPMGVKVWNFSGMSKVSNDSSDILQTNQYGASLYSLSDLAVSSTEFSETINYFRPSQINKYMNTEHFVLPVMISLSISGNSSSFGPYNFSDPYYIALFQQQFQTKYPGTTPPVISTSGGNYVIDIQATSLDFTSMTVTAGGISHTYAFSTCGTGGAVKRAIADKNDWKGAKIAQEDIEFAVKKSVAEGDELNMPMPDAPLNLVTVIDKESYSNAGIAKYQVKNDSIDWKGVFDFSLKGTYVLHISSDSTYWMDGKGRRVTDSKAIVTLENIVPNNKAKLLSEHQEQNRKQIQEMRLHAQKTAADEIQKKYKKDWDKAGLNDSIAGSFEKFRKNNDKKTTFSYTDDIKSRYVVNYQTSQSKIKGSTTSSVCQPILNNNFSSNIVTPTYNSSASVLGSTNSVSKSVGGYLGAGIGWKNHTKKSTFGAQLTHGWNHSESFVSLVDIDGDGLDDIVLKSGDNLYFKKHIVTRTFDNNNLPVVSHSFNEKLLIPNLSQFYYQKGQSSSYNFQATFGICAVGGFAGVDFAKSNAETSIYFTDANGDGLMDVVQNGEVLFNHLENGIPTFGSKSDNTENMVVSGKAISITYPAEYNLPKNDTLAGYDVVRMWEAPADGLIKITNTISLTDNTKQAVVSIEKQLSSPSIDTLKIQPMSGKVALLETWNPNIPKGHFDQIMANAWTSGGTAFTNKTLMDFDLSSIPVGATITSAKISLYGINSAGTGYSQYITPNTENIAQIYRIILPWAENTVTWNNFPQNALSNLNIKETPAIQSTPTNILNLLNFDLTSLVQDYINNKTSSYGFLFKLKNETIYRRVIFASSNYSDATKHPKLVITYTAPTVNSGNAGGCGKAPAALCLLFGTILNSSHPSVNNVIITNSTSCSPSQGPLLVKKGDRIYFRVHQSDTLNVPVNWDPKIEYTDANMASTTDQNGLKPYNSSYSDGFILSGDREETFPGDGTATISWNPIQVSNLSDSVTFEIVRRNYFLTNDSLINETPIFKRTIAPTTTATITSDGIGSIPISGYASTPPLATKLIFRIKSTSNVNWKQIEWKPKMECTVSSPLYGPGGSATAAEATMETTETRYPIVNYSIYKSFLCSAPYNTLSLSATSNVRNIIPVFGSIFSSSNNGILNFVVKSNGQLLGARKITVTNGVASFDNSSPISLPTAAATIEMGFYSDDSQLPIEQVSLLSVLAFSTVQYLKKVDNGTTTYLGSQNINFFQKVNPQYGPMYRQWGQFMYNPKAVTGGVPIVSLPGTFIKESALVVSQAQALQTRQATDALEGTQGAGFNNLNMNDTAAVSNFERNLTAFQNTNQALAKSAFITAQPSRQYSGTGYVDKWIGMHEQCYSQATTCSSANMTKEYGGFYNPAYDVVQTSDIHTGAHAISKYTISSGKNVSAGVNVSAGIAQYGITGSKSLSGKNNSLTDYADMNGDRYPDIVTKDELQYTNRTGGLNLKTPKNQNLSGSGEFTKAESDSWGAGATGSFSGGGKTVGGSTGGVPGKPIIGKPSFEKPSGNSSIGISGNFSKSKDETTRLWSDINGDGLTDFIEKNGSVLTIRLNLGNNTYGAPQLLNLSSFTYLSKGKSISYGGGNGVSLFGGSFEAGVSNNSTFNTQEYALQDMNGDGLPDIVRSTDDNLYVRLNLGIAFETNETTFANFSLKNSARTTSESYNAGFSLAWITPIFGIPFKFPCVNVNGQYQTSTNRTEKSIIDFDGDGFPDLLEVIGDNQIRVSYSNIRRTNKLKTVRNPLGGSFTIDYQAKTKDYNNPNAKWVMSEVRVKDGYDLPNDGADSIVKNFEYKNGKYDRREREFYGFETVKTIDYTRNPDGTKSDVYRTSENKYYNGSYFLKGLLKQSSVYQGSDPTKLYSSQENIYEIKTMKNNNTEIDLQSTPSLTFDVGGTEGRRTAIVLLKESFSRNYELGTTPVVSKTGLVYDESGRVTSFLNYGDLSNTADDYTSTISYTGNLTSYTKNITNIPGSIIVKVNGQIIRARYTANINYETGAIGKIIATIDNTAGNTAETDLEYDTYGNLKKITLPPNKNNERMYYSWTYDVDNNKYVNVVTDTKGYSSSTTYDPAFDAVLSSTDITGNMAQYQYDTFGRLIKITGPNEVGVGTDPYTIKFEYFPLLTNLLTHPTYYSCVSYMPQFFPVAISKHYDPQHTTNSIDTYTFIDGLARPVQVKKDIEINTNTDRHGTPSYLEYMSVSGKVSYDTYGRAIEQFHPTSEIRLNSTCPKNLMINNTAVSYSSKTDYDVLDRPVKSTDPDGNISTMEYSVSTNMLKTRSVTDQNGSQSVISESYKDATGNVVKTNNIGPNGDVITSFVYDPIGQLLTYTDAENLTSTYTYDWLGRKLTFTHPDNGLTSYTYDKAGNISKLITANLAYAGTFVTYNYDFNRLTGVVYPPLAAGVANIANVTFVYGDPGSIDANSRGRLITQSDASGNQTFRYDKMGNVSYNKRVVVAPSPALPTRTYITSYTYDSWNRVQNILYPDGESLTYRYNRGGNVDTIVGTYLGVSNYYVQRIDYDQYEQRTYLKYGNNTETFYNYTPSLRRLKNMTVKNPASVDLINDTYAYDKTGNILSVANTALPVSNMGGATANTYSYDVLNRLQTASGAFTGNIAATPDNRSQYTLAMTYSNTGKINTKVQSHSKNGVNVTANTYNNTYNYVSGSHKLSTITNGSTDYFGYDRNGNMSSWYRYSTPTALYWDEANRLRVVLSNYGSTLQHYIYDASGDRVLKARSTSTALYANGALVNSSTTMDNYTTYPSGLLVVSPTGIYSKHYYIGSQRIASRVGDGTATIFEGSGLKSSETESSSSELDALKLRQQQDLLYYAAKANIKELKYAPYEMPSLSELTEESTLKSAAAVQTYAIYYYHPDHLGSNTLITNTTGVPYQLFLNLPFGETMAEQTTSTGTYQSPYKFNGKELDAETGLYYYGARYYDPKSSVWLSVDPLASKYSKISPYTYCLNNPIKYLDLKGDSVWLFSTTLPGSDPKNRFINKATHTFLYIKPDDGPGKHFTFGPKKGDSFGGDPLVSSTYEQDNDVIQGKNTDALKLKLLIDVPKGMTNDEFDKKAIESAESFGNNPGITYNALSNSDLTGNCNTSSSTILFKSGVSKEAIHNIEGLIPGLNWGFGDIKPWTIQEQNNAVKNAEVKSKLEINRAIYLYY